MDTSTATATASDMALISYLLSGGDSVAESF